jgi:NAD(P)-dependent dehydrogenase (short-subunit alcohol dehydrogenase family)
MINGKTAIVTGGASGIGAATVKALSGAGAKVMIVDVAEAAGMELREKLRSEGAACEFFKANVSDEASVVQYVQRTIEWAGKIDIFINNAGIEGTVHPIMEYPVEDFDRVLAINLRGAFLGLKHVLKIMVAQKSGNVVNTASVAGLRGSVGMCAYVSSKHAILGLTKTAAMEVAKFGVRVNAVCPGPIDTRMIHSLSQMSNPANPTSVAEQMIARNPSGRLGTPEEVAQTILFLASDACPYLNGESITIDGARTAV